MVGLEPGTAVPLQRTFWGVGPTRGLVGVPSPVPVLSVQGCLL